jgi:hypothetical protein
MVLLVLITVSACTKPRPATERATHPDTWEPRVIEFEPPPRLEVDDLLVRHRRLRGDRIILTGWVRLRPAEGSAFQEELGKGGVLNFVKGSHTAVWGGVPEKNWPPFAAIYDPQAYNKLFLLSVRGTVGRAWSDGTVPLEDCELIEGPTTPK